LHLSRQEYERAHRSPFTDGCPLLQESSNEELLYHGSTHRNEMWLLEHEQNVLDRVASRLVQPSTHRERPKDGKTTERTGEGMKKNLKVALTVEELGSDSRVVQHARFYVSSITVS
jgi:hypothetical protein